MGVKDIASNVLYGTFSAECVVRRAAKVLEVLGALAEDGGLENPAGVELVDEIRSCLLRWSKGEQGRSLSSAHVCAPVRLDTSERTRQDFFGLGTGDRVISAEGEATVLGVTRHSIWVSVDMTSPPSSCSTGLGRGSRVWDSEIPNEGQDDIDRCNREHTSTRMAATQSPSYRSTIDRRESKTRSWSRCTVREIVGRPENYIISSGAATMDSAERPISATGVNHDHGGVRQHGPGVAAAVVDLLSADELRNILPRWTRAMDEELGRRLDKLADSMAVTCLLDLPICVLDKLPTSRSIFPLTASLGLPEVWARAALLLYVNDLILPLLPLVDVSTYTCGPLRGLVHKCRHLVLKQPKLLLLNT